MARTIEPQLSFADCEFRQQGIWLDPTLQTIADFLHSRAEMIEAVRCDLLRGLKQPHSGRRGMTPPQVLRSLIVMRIKNWDYRELGERIADGYTLCGFTEFFSRPVPKHDAFNRAFNRLTPQTLEAGKRARCVIRQRIGLGSTLFFSIQNSALKLCDVGRGSAVRHFHCSFAYSATACFRMGMSGSASFQSVRKSL
jgi:hypothetical protein